MSHPEETGVSATTREAEPGGSKRRLVRQTERFLDAAESCYTRFGLAKTSMEDVARQAGASRATLYRHFDNRNDLLLDVLARQARSMAAQAETHLRGVEGIGNHIVEGLLFCLREMPKRPLFACAFAPADVGTASRVALGSEQMLAIGIKVLGPIFEPARQRGLLRDSVCIEVLMEWVLRVLASYLTVPSRLAATEAEMRELFQTMLLPALLAPATTHASMTPPKE